MTTEHKGNEKRKFLRYDYNKPLAYLTLNESSDKNIASNILTAVSNNLSAAGILFTANVNKLPGISTVLAMDIDYQTASVCKEIEERALVLKDKLIGRVVRIEDNEDGTCGVGVAFVTKSDRMAKEIKNIESLIK
ncbi:hypothetical protein ACFL60_00425 [Candidatus Omnitrophota bacterium]